MKVSFKIKKLFHQLNLKFSHVTILTLLNMDCVQCSQNDDNGQQINKHVWVTRNHCTMSEHKVAVTITRSWAHNIASHNSPFISLSYFIAWMRTKPTFEMN